MNQGYKIINFSFWITHHIRTKKKRTTIENFNLTRTKQTTDLIKKVGYRKNSRLS